MNSDSDMKITTGRKLLRVLGATEDAYHVQTETLQLKILDRETGENQVISPVIYQNCMKPDDIRIFPLTVKISTDDENNIIMAENRYERIRIDLRRQQVQVSKWKAEIHKTECIKCENCGRCGW